MAQSKYLESLRHNAALKVVFVEMARELRLIESVPPWYSCAVPEPVYESPEGLAFWDVPAVFAEHTTVKANRVDARFVDHKNKVWAVDNLVPRVSHGGKMRDPGNEIGLWRCPVSGWYIKKEKTLGDRPLRFELKKQYPSYDVEQFNFIIDVAGGWSRDLDLTIRKLFGSRAMTYFEKNAEGYHPEFIKHSENFQSHRHLAE